MSHHCKLRLPRELLSAALKYLSQHELRNASEASWSLYHAAHDAGLSLHRVVHSGRPDTLKTFAEVVKHAKAQTQLFRLELTLLIFGRAESGEGCLPPMHEIWSVARLSMPFLVRLDVQAGSKLAGAIYAALDVPARQLQTLSLIILPDKSNPAEVPPTLFGGNAPRLHTVALNIPTLLPTWPQVPAWSAVSALSVTIGYEGQQLAVAHFSHGLRYLDVRVAYWRGQGQGPCVDISGLVLDSLTLDNDAGAPLQFACDPRPSISTVKHLSRAVHHDERLWPDTDCALNAHIQAFYTPGVKRGHNEDGFSQVEVAFMLRDHPAPRVLSGLVVSVSSADGTPRWGNTQYTRPAVPGGLTLPALDALPLLRSRLVSLAIDDALVSPLLQTSCTLDVLRELYVDCTVVCNSNVSAPPLESVLRCPLVESITAFKTDSGTAALVPIERVHALARLEAGRRVQLVLARVTVVDGEEGHPRLSEMFSSIRIVDDADARFVPGYYHRREENPRLATWSVGSDSDSTCIDFSDTSCISGLTRA